MFCFNYDEKEKEKSEKLLKMLEYCYEVRKFKKSFLTLMGKVTKKQFEWSKIWAQWIIRNLNKQKLVFHPIPDPRNCVDDPDLIENFELDGCKDKDL